MGLHLICWSNFISILTLAKFFEIFIFTADDSKIGSKRSEISV